MQRLQAAPEEEREADAEQCDGFAMASAEDATLGFADGDVADQVRVTTPARAREIGSDFIVVGRPITAAADPVAAYRRCVAEFVG